MAACRCSTIAKQKERDDLLRWSQARLPHSGEGDHRTFENFNLRPGTEKMFEAAKRFITREGPHILVLAGDVGRGKTHTLEAIGREVLAQGWTVRYELVSEMLQRLAECNDFDSKQSVMEWLDWYWAKDTLLLDDLAVERMRLTDWKAETLTTIVDKRITDQRRTVIAINLTKPEMERFCGDRLTSRIYQGNPKLNDVALVNVTASEDYR